MMTSSEHVHIYTYTSFVHCLLSTLGPYSEMASTRFFLLLLAILLVPLIAVVLQFVAKSWSSSVSCFSLDLTDFWFLLLIVLFYQKLYTAEELARYNGTEESLPLLLGILGYVSMIMLIFLLLLFCFVCLMMMKILFYSVAIAVRCLMWQRGNLITVLVEAIIISLEGWMFYLLIVIVNLLPD